MTNHPWRFSIAALKARFGFERLEVINDFTALALALPRLGPDDRMTVGGGVAVPDMPLACSGPARGSGFQASSRRRRMGAAQRRRRARDDGARDRSRKRCARPYAPAFRPCLSRAGAVRPGSGQPLQHFGRDRWGARRTATRRRRSPTLRCAARTRCVPRRTTMFCAMLGTMAGNLALTLGARGGVYIARRHRAATRQPLRRFAVSRALPGDGPVRALSRGDPDPCRDPPVARFSRLRRCAGELTGSDDRTL